MFRRDFHLFRLLAASLFCVAFAIDAVIGHCKTDGHLGRNFLHGRLGDRITTEISAVG